MFPIDNVQTEDKCDNVRILHRWSW